MNETLMNITEIVDILNDYNFPNNYTRSSYIKTDDTNGTYFPLVEQNYTGDLLFYDSSTRMFTYTIPSHIYEYKKVGFKAIKINESGYQVLYNMFFTYSDIAESISKCINFGETNKNNGIEYFNLNQNRKIVFWFKYPYNTKNYDINTLSTYFNNFIIEFDFTL